MGWGRRQRASHTEPFAFPARKQLPKRTRGGEQSEDEDREAKRKKEGGETPGEERVCACVCARAHVYVRVCVVCARIYVHVCVVCACVHLVCVHTCAHVLCVHVCVVYAYTCLCCACTCVCCTCTCVCICVHVSVVRALHVCASYVHVCVCVRVRVADSPEGRGLSESAVSSPHWSSRCPWAALACRMALQPPGSLFGERLGTVIWLVQCSVKRSFSLLSLVYGKYVSLNDFFVLVNLARKQRSPDCHGVLGVFVIFSGRP